MLATRDLPPRSARPGSRLARWRGVGSAFLAKPLLTADAQGGVAVLHRLESVVNLPQATALVERGQGEVVAGVGHGAGALRVRGPNCASGAGRGEPAISASPRPCPLSRAHDPPPLLPSHWQALGDAHCHCALCVAAPGPLGRQHNKRCAQMRNIASLAFDCCRAHRANGQGC